MSHTDVSDFQPTSLSHLIGQRNVIRQVEVALDAAQQDCKRFDHAMLVGPPGLGKSALASIIAQEMATDFHEVLGQSSITADHLQKACELEHIDSLGRGPNEQQYLRILGEGPNRLNVLASRLSVSEMARMCDLSRSRFYALIVSGVFPQPVRNASCWRPHYDRELQQKCLDIRRTGIGFNGLLVMFNRKASGQPSKPRRRAKQVADIDLENCKIRINDGKGGKDRYVLFGKAFATALRTHIAVHPDNRWLFQTRRNSRFTTRRVQQIVKQYAEQAGVKATPHTFRHQAITWLTRHSGMADAELQLITGHARRETLAVYQHVALDGELEEKYQGAMKEVGL